MSKRIVLTDHVLSGLDEVIKVLQFYKKEPVGITLEQKGRKDLNKVPVGTTLTYDMYVSSTVGGGTIQTLYRGNSQDTYTVSIFKAAPFLYIVTSIKDWSDTEIYPEVLRKTFLIESIRADALSVLATIRPDLVCQIDTSRIWVEHNPVRVRKEYTETYFGYAVYFPLISSNRYYTAVYFNKIKTVQEILIRTDLEEESIRIFV